MTIDIPIGQPSSVAISDSTVAVGDLSGALLRFTWPAGSEAVLVQAQDDRGPLTGTTGGFVTAGGWDATVRGWDKAGEKALWSTRPVDGRVTAVCWADGDQGVVLAAGADRASDEDRRNTDAGSADKLVLNRSQVFALRENGSSAIVLQGNGEISRLTSGRDWWAAVDRDNPGTGKPIQQHLRLIVAGVETAVPWLTGTVLAASGHLHLLAVATETQVWRYDVAADHAEVVGEVGADDPQILALTLAGDAVIGMTSEGLIGFPGGHRLADENPSAGHGRTQPVAMTNCGDDFLVLWPDGVLEQQTAGGSVRSSLALRVQV